MDISTAAAQLKMPLGTGIYPAGIGTYHCGTSLWQPVNYYTVPIGLLKKSLQLESSSKSQKRGKTSRPGLKPEFAERISKHIMSVTDLESDEVCNLFAGQSPLVEEREAVCLAV